MPVEDQVIRDWMAFYNAEPFESTLRDVDVYAYYEKAGFKPEGFFHGLPTSYVAGFEPQGGQGRPPKEWANWPGAQVIGATK